ncbi:restriction endonuclease subunit S [Gabonibacter sp. KD22]|nr:restriction endonuclease subunit S [Gabonibacter chumensis]MCR9012512.1 restriction endonuclease subunit S [Gabonibacter chumensis]
MRFPEFTDEWKRSSLGEVTTFVKERIGADKLTRNNYVSTENMNPDFGGINQASSVPNNTNVIHYQKGDVLLSNIRPYLRKVWAASSDGGCSADVFVFRAKSISSSFLHYIMANDTFINYVMSGAKGVKMPRGDKEQILKYIFSTPNIEEQNKISHLLHLLDERISTQNKIIDKLQSLIKGLTVTLTIKGKPNTTISKCLACHSSTLQESEVSSNGLYKVFGANGLVGYTDVPQMNGDAILVIKDGSGVGTVTYVQGKFSVIGTLNYLTVIGNNDLRYLYFALSVFNFQPYKTGMAIPHIYFKDYGNAKIYCPPLTEQKRIANVLGKLESKLLLEQELITLFNQQKQYLLRQMFI